MARLTRKEWRRLIRHGHALCHRLKMKGVRAQITPYKGDQNTSGLCIQAVDCGGRVIKGYKTGTSRYDVMMMALALGARRLERECAR